MTRAELRTWAFWVFVVMATPNWRVFFWREWAKRKMCYAAYSMGKASQRSHNALIGRLHKGFNR